MCNRYTFDMAIRDMGSRIQEKKDMDNKVTFLQCVSMSYSVVSVDDVVVVPSFLR